MGRWLVLILILGSFASLGCSREKKSSSSTITIRVPQSANSHNKTGGVGAMSSLPTDRKVCYGVVVNGPGMNQPRGNQCTPAASVRAGFVEAGSTVEVMVDKGVGRTVELYAYLLSAGDTTGPCPGFGDSMPPTKVASTYLIGTAPNVDTMGDETRVDIEVSFPGLTNNYAVERGLASVCTSSSVSGGGGPSVGQMSAGYQRAVAGSGEKIIGRVGAAMPNTVLTAGDGSKLKVKQ
jgi:hypothetical protein